MAPLILTLGLEADAQARFDRLRDAHFPPERNFLSAHVTLFHHLPPEDSETIAAALAQETAAVAPFPVAVTGVRSLGRGVAYVLASAELAQLRNALARRWENRLTAQDMQKFQPHITIQNKASADTARTLLTQLAGGFTPFDVQATGLLLWHYRGGPWEAAGGFPFTGPPAALPTRPHR